MKIDFESVALAQCETPVLVVACFESGSTPLRDSERSRTVSDQPKGSPVSSGTVELLPAETRALLEELKASGELTGKALETTLLHRPAGLAAKKLLIVGAGKKEKVSTDLMRRLAGTAMRYLRARGVHELAWVVQDAGGPVAVQAVVEGAIVADYDADRYRTEPNFERRIDRMALTTGGAPSSDALRAAAERGRIIAEAQNFVRDLVNEPSNRMTPTILAEQSQKMAARFGLECRILDADEIRSRKMGALWAVAQGSDEPPKLIVLRYEPPDLPDARQSGAPHSPVIGLVGKGVTFDTGGISIKPAEAMHEMKTDMAGGATMLGVMQAIAQLKPRVRVLALVPATENMPSGKAYKPGDVITSMSGKTIEILNTDAEGRLVLADALTYAKELGATVLIDAATLTGAVTIALGNTTTGVFGWNKEWVDKVLKSAEAAGERMWPLPVDEEYRELYKSTIADLANTGGRYAGASTAAMFVGEFAGDTPWVHLDIAGTRWSNEEKPYRAKGPTGHGVPTLVHLLTSLGN
ncbi:MAG: leucyl aminopeptidase [Acidobacteria bacterium]|nr:MAG: leucyl aminopeptidase [Acidobacteriota bacterium]